MKTFEEKWTAWLDGELTGAEILKNEDFFSHQIRERIAREKRARDRSGRRTTWWTVPRLALGGAVSLALFMLCAVFVIHDKNPAEQSQYLTQILNARVDTTVNPNATISIFETKEDKITVLWVEGLQSLPADYAAK
jgi:hypothetical protein